MLTIDGSLGEGGGQILRTALALSAVTGKPFRIEKIRAARDKPGLLRQHLTAAKAAAQICGAVVDGDVLGFIAANASSSCSRRMRRVTISSKSRRPCW
jgi:RNA 3'-terminal phosphate cyclase (ATP)